jgi:hypothetical protein
VLQKLAFGGVAVEVEFVLGQAMAPVDLLSEYALEKGALGEFEAFGKLSVGQVWSLIP